MIIIHGLNDMTLPLKSQGAWFKVVYHGYFCLQLFSIKQGTWREVCLEIKANSLSSGLLPKKLFAD